MVGVTGAIEAGVTLMAFLWTLNHANIEVARGAAFMTLVFSELFRAFAARSAADTFWRVGPRSNWLLVAVVGLSAALQVGLAAFGPTQVLFGMAPLTLTSVVMAAVLALAPVSFLEIRKLLFDRRPV